jgi:hypothetical protein
MKTNAETKPFLPPTVSSFAIVVPVNDLEKDESVPSPGRMTSWLVLGWNPSTKVYDITVGRFGSERDARARAAARHKRQARVYGALAG